MDNNRNKFLFNPISLSETLRNFSITHNKFLVFIWMVCTLGSIYFGIATVQSNWSGMPISFLGMDIHVTIFPPMIISILFALWFGFWWGFIPIFLTSFSLALYSGISIYWSFLFGFVDFIGLAILTAAYRTIPVSLGLRSLPAISFYIFIVFISAISTSPGAIIWTYTNNLGVHDTYSIWQGWWLGGFIVRAIINGLIFYFATPFVYKWKNIFEQTESWQPPDLIYIKKSLTALITVFFVFMFFNRYVSKINLDELLTNINDRNLIVEMYSAFDGIVVTDWILLSFIIFIAYFSYQAAINWNKSLSDSLKDLSFTLKKEEENYQTLFEQASDAIFISDHEGNYTNVNFSAFSMLGYTKEELLKLNIKDLLDPEDLIRYPLQLNKLLDGKEIILERNLIAKDGRIINGEISAKLLKDGRLLGLFRNLTERKETEAQLKKLSSAVKHSPASIIIMDLVGNIEYANPKFTEVTGYELSEVLGKNPKFLTSETVPDMFYEEIENKIKRGEQWFGEFHNKKKNGDLFWELASISPITNEKNEITHYVAVKEDITERKINEKHLSEAIMKAEQSDKLKTEFLAQMSHEIRTPMNSLLSYSRLIEDEVFDLVSDDIKEGFQILNSSGNRILRTINLILNMSEIQTGSYNFHQKKIDIHNDILKKLHHEFLINIRNKNFDLILSQETKNSIVLGDEYSISQIFYNLIDNAIKYTSKGNIEIKTYSDDNEVLCVDIKDTGIGISEDFQENLFHPFRQEEQGYTRNFDGNGLGLALVKNYCDLNSAEILVNSVKGLGSTFTVKFTNVN